MSTQGAAPDLLSILTASAEDVSEQLAAVREHGPAYMRCYAEWYLTHPERAGRGAPLAPPGLPKEMAALIRETVRERALSVRTSGRRIAA